MKDAVRSAHRAVDLTLTGFQQDISVMETARLVGIFTRGNLRKEPEEQDRNLSTRQKTMRTEFEITRPSKRLYGTLTRIQHGECRGLMVVENQKVVGLLIMGNIMDLLAQDVSGHPVIGCNPSLLS
jgi:signal-transduction protein with cAMP-binding, CBS, and nucleotidyltransferase domain